MKTLISGELGVIKRLSEWMKQETYRLSIQIILSLLPFGLLFAQTIDSQEGSQYTDVEEVDSILVICPAIIINGSSELIELISSPSNVYLRNSRKWRFVPVRETSLRLTTEECGGDSEPRYLCRGCKNVNETHKECAHASMDPSDPCYHQRYPDGQVLPARDICYVITVRAKTCFEDERGTLRDCKVKMRPPRRNPPGTGEQTEGAVHRAAYIRYPFECVAESTDVQTPHKLWAGCPDCPENQRFNVRLRCVQHRNSRYPCGSDQHFVRLEILDEYIGNVYECYERCPETGSADTPQQGNQGDVQGGVRR